MSTLQNLRNKAQELINLANVDQAFGQLLQQNPAAALCTAGIPNAVFAAAPVEEACDYSWTCSWTCWWTCSWTGSEM